MIKVDEECSSIDLTLESLLFNHNNNIPRVPNNTWQEANNYTPFLSSKSIIIVIFFADKKTETND